MGVVRRVIAIVVFVSSGLVTSSVVHGDATLKPLVDEGWVSVRTLSGSGQQAVRFRDVPEYYERISTLLAKMPNWKTCGSITSAPCATAPSIEFSAVFQPCSTPTQLDCLVEFGTINSQNVREPATYVKAFPTRAMNGFPAEPSVGLPGGGPGGLWTVAASSGAPVRTHYVGAMVYGTTTPGQKVSFKNFYATISPVDITTFSCPGPIDEKANCSPAYVPNPPEDTRYAGFDGYVDEFGRGAGLDCVMTGNLDTTTKLAECALRKAISRDVRYYMSVRLSQAVSGWLHGRMENPDITIEDVAGVNGAVTMSIAAKAVTVPVIDVEKNFADLPSALQEKYRATGGWEGGSASGYGDAAFESDPLRRNRESHPTPSGAKSIDELEAWIPVVNDSAVADLSTWSVRTLGAQELGAARGCVTEKNKVAGIVTTNATVYKAAAPVYDSSTKSLNYTVAAPHYMSSGELFKGTYSLVMRSDVARCIYGFTSGPITSTVQVVDTDAQPTNVVTNATESNGWLHLVASGFTHSSPTIRAKLSQAPSTSAARIAVGRSASRATLLKWARLTAGSKSKVTFSVAKSSKSICRVTGTSVKGVKKGTCSVTVKVRTGKKQTSKSVRFRVG